MSSKLIAFLEAHRKVQDAQINKMYLDLLKDVKLYIPTEYLQFCTFNPASKGGYVKIETPVADFFATRNGTHIEFVDDETKKTGWMNFSAKISMELSKQVKNDKEN